MDEKFIAQRLARLRTQMNVSARDMSLSMGQASNYINNIENGKSFPSIQGLFYICECLKISPKEFFDGGNTNPALLNEVIDQLKPLNDKALEAILAFICEIREK
jgi:transcriptional regulator with XRE-family HTH domain